MIDLDEAAGPPGSTVRHLLAHTSGLPFEGAAPIAQPGRRRIYSNEAFRVLAEHVAARAEMPFAEYVLAAVCVPLEIGLDPTGDPGSGMHASLEDVLAIGRELESPRLVAPETRDEMVAVQFPGLAGVLPDYGRFDPLDWGLGVQLNTVAALVDGDADVRASVRALRRHGHLPLGRSGRRGCLCRADDTRVRRLGEGGVAAFLGRGARGAPQPVGRAGRRLAAVPSARNAIDGRKVYFEDDGGSGVPVVLYGGILDSVESVRASAVASALQALSDEFRLIYADHRGLGRSDKPHETDCVRDAAPGRGRDRSPRRSRRRERSCRRQVVRRTARVRHRRARARAGALDRRGRSATVCDRSRRAAHACRRGRARGDATGRRRALRRSPRGALGVSESPTSSGGSTSRRTARR